ncbi:MAG: hypothetical protein PHW58_06320 [Candidatus Methanofastidiosa archaeon]|nr:hypothetical protein [Candidatus Methanofastidiosa archaeon]
MIQYTLEKAHALLEYSIYAHFNVPLCKTCMNHHHRLGTAQPLHACLDKAFLLIQ